MRRRLEASEIRCYKVKEFEEDETHIEILMIFCSKIGEKGGDID